MARSSSALALSLPRFLRDLVLVLASAGFVVLVTFRWVAVPWSVDGPSMRPALEAGDRVVVEIWSRRSRSPSLGDIVLLEGTDGSSIVKRVGTPPAGTALPFEPSIWVQGDNLAESADSRGFGPVPLGQVRGRVVWRYWPPSRWGPIE